MSYWVYVIKGESTGRYYVRSTGDLPDRIRRHNANRSAATRNRGPWRVVYTEEFISRQEAANRERAIKAQKSRACVERLVRAARVG